MLSFREASIGQPILGLIVGIVLIIALPDGLAGVPTSAGGWIVGAWSLVWLLGVAGKDVVDVGAAVAVMGDSSAAQTALEVGGPQARPLISC